MTLKRGADRLSKHTHINTAHRRLGLFEKTRATKGPEFIWRTDLSMEVIFKLKFEP